MLDGKRGWIKKYLLDQSFIAGIGNVYVQDMLWYARLHPKRRADSLTRQEVEGLHRAIQDVLNDGISYGGGPGEQDIWATRGDITSTSELAIEPAKLVLSVEPR